MLFFMLCRLVRRKNLSHSLIVIHIQCGKGCQTARFDALRFPGGGVRGKGCQTARYRGMRHGVTLGHPMPAHAGDALRFPGR